MPQVDPVVVVIQADIRNYELNVSRAERLGDEKLGAIERQAGQMGKGVSRSFNLAAGAAKTYAVALKAAEIAQEYLRITDAAKSLETQLRFATSETGNFAQATDDVRRIAAETRAGLEDTAQLYGRIVRNSRALGLSQEDAARATETFAKTVKISGASAEEASAATTKFAEALADGALSSDELQSILQSSPRLASLLAESLGVTVTELYAMGQAGQLSADQLFAALTERKFTEQIDAEVRELPVTFSDAMTQVENAAITTFGAFDRGGRFSEALVNFITDGSKGFSDLETAAENFGINARAEIEGLASAFDPVIKAAMRLLDLIDLSNNGMGFWQQDMRDLDNVLNWWQDQGLAGRITTGGSLSDWWNDTPQKPFQFEKRYLDARNRSLQEGREAKLQRDREAGRTPVSRILRSLSDAQRRADEKARPKPITLLSTRPGASSAGNSASAQSAAANADRERQAAKRDEETKQREREKLDDDLLAAQQATARAVDDILRYKLDAIERERNRSLAELSTDEALKRLGEDEVEERKAIVNQTADLKTQLAKRVADEAKAAMELARSRDDTNTRKIEAKLIRNREARLEAEKRILDSTYAEEEAAIRSRLAGEDIAVLKEALANLHRRQDAQKKQLERDSASPAEKYLDELNDEAANLGDAYEEIAVGGLKRMNEEFTNAISKALGLHGVLGDIISDFIELAIRQAVIRPLAELLGGGGGGGGIFGAIFKGIGGLLGGSIGGGGGIQFGGDPLSLDTISVGLGRASGGYAEAGRLYRINEAASPGRVEGFVPQGSGQIIPLGQMNTPAAMPGGGSAGVVQIQVVEGQMFEPRVRVISGDVSVQTVRGAAPALIEASARETIARSRRPTL